MLPKIKEESIQGLLTLQPCLALFAKTTQTRHETQAMASPLSNFITNFEAVLAITLRDRDIFCRYCVMPYSFRMTKFHKSCLVPSKKCPLSHASVKCQQTLLSFLTNYLTSNSSTSKIKVLFGGIIPGTPCSP